MPLQFLLHQSQYPIHNLLPVQTGGVQQHGVIGLPQEDLFVVYQGINSADSSIHLDARVNRLISVLWLGLLLLCAGMLLSTIGARTGEQRE